MIWRLPLSQFLAVTLILLVNLHRTLATVCVVSFWEAWGPCVGNCKFALQVRNRDVIRPPFPERLEDGRLAIRPCPVLYQVQTCTLNVCSTGEPVLPDGANNQNLGHPFSLDRHIGSNGLLDADAAAQEQAHARNLLTFGNNVAADNLHAGTTETGGINMAKLAPPTVVDNDWLKPLDRTTTTSTTTTVAPTSVSPTTRRPYWTRNIFGHHGANGWKSGRTVRPRFRIPSTTKAFPRSMEVGFSIERKETTAKATDWKLNEDRTNKAFEPQTKSPWDRRPVQRFNSLKPSPIAIEVLNNGQSPDGSITDRYRVTRKWTGDYVTTAPTPVPDNTTTTPPSTTTEATTTTKPEPVTDSAVEKPISVVGSIPRAFINLRNPKEAPTTTTTTTTVPTTTTTTTTTTTSTTTSTTPTTTTTTKFPTSTIVPPDYVPRRKQPSLVIPRSDKVFNAPIQILSKPGPDFFRKQKLKAAVATPRFTAYYTKKRPTTQAPVTTTSSESVAMEDPIKHVDAHDSMMPLIVFNSPKTTKKSSKTSPRRVTTRNRVPDSPWRGRGSVGRHPINSRNWSQVWNFDRQDLPGIGWGNVIVNTPKVPETTTTVSVPTSTFRVKTATYGYKPTKAFNRENWWRTTKAARRLTTQWRNTRRISTPKKNIRDLSWYEIVKLTSPVDQIERTTAAPFLKEVRGYHQVAQQPKDTNRPCGSPFGNQRCCRIPWTPKCSDPTRRPQRVVRWARSVADGECVPYAFAYCGYRDEQQQGPPLKFEEDCYDFCFTSEEKRTLPIFAKLGGFEEGFRKNEARRSQ